ncbi:hypothetical protein SIN8267_03128 [Sinobacterium norvegicum]|uniref:Transmembrane protein n=1 Tax=Sinobacterium norvegicum TaxID=1641715 RepID=A0ABM9AID9_9GAMM|nr:hypothetical protein [Sinobacterium norvegicum]CAH0992989.1 hypothetical protein SIN8267_03128 [Sinobacterium norvegicum]
MQTSSSIEDRSTKQSPLWATRLKLSAILALPILMIAASTFVYVTGVGMPTGTKNRGQLVVPAAQISDQLAVISGQDESTIPGQGVTWSMLYQEPKNGCKSDCLNSLYFIRQTHKAIGKYAPLLNRYYISREGKLNSDLLKNYPALIQLKASEQLMTTLENTNERQKPQYYLVDKQGFLMMTYSQENTLKDYITDLKFLFSNSE